MAQTPKRGGLFRAGIHDGNTNDTLDPAVSVSFYTVQLNMLLRSFPAEISATNEMPRLEERRRRGAVEGGGDV